MNTKKSVLSLLFSLLFLVLNIPVNSPSILAVDIGPRAGDINLDIDISSKTPEILSGNNAIFEMNLKITGNQVEYDNVHIYVNLPDNAKLSQQLDELKIVGITPIQNIEENRLEYIIPKLVSGVAEQIIFNLNTENGLPNDSKVVLSAGLLADGFEQVTTSSSSTVISTLEQTVQKTYIQTLDPANNVVSRAPIQGDMGEWSLSLNIPNKDLGQEYLKPGSIISITDTLPNTLTYFSDDQNGVYNSSNRTITWQFKVPTVEEQKKSDDIFSVDVTLKTKFSIRQTDISTDVNNTMKTSVTTITGQSIKKESTGTIYQGSGSSGDPVIAPSGSTFIFVHYGPVDGAGNGPGEFNPNPTVGPNALLKFYVSQTPYTADSPSTDFTSYEMNYKIDDKLTLVKLYESKEIRYRPNASYPKGVNLPAESNVMDVYATVDGEEEKIVSSFVPGKTYERSEFLAYQSEDQHISSLRYVSKYRHAGISTYQGLFFKPKADASGRVINQVNYNYEGFNYKGDSVNYKSNYSTDIFANVSSATGPRYANISQNITNIPKPIVSTSIEFIKQNNGIVELGDNQVSGKLKLEKTSKTLIDAPYSAYIVLPKGVTYNTETTADSPDYKVELVDTNYNQLNQELVRVSWDKTDQLLFTEELSYSFDVSITPSAPTLIVPTMYTYIGTKDFEVPFYTEDIITNTSISNNNSDLNGSGNKDELVLLTRNQYSLIRSNKIVGKELVKGELDSEYSEFGYTKLGGNIDYRIELTNYGDAGKEFVLMNVLPSIGDLGITDNNPLNTLYDPILKGAVTLPKDTADEYVVYYSTSKNPKRDDLIENVNWPSSTVPIENPLGAEDPNWIEADKVIDWSTIHSFMIKGKSEYPIVNEEKLTIDFQMKAPDILSSELLNSNVPGEKRAAWNSFAYTINNLQPVEPAKIGVAVNESAYNLKIIKEISDTGKKLESAEFTLYDKDHLILDTQISDKNGELYFDNLTAGIYYLEETNAPPGYALNSKVYELEISADGTMEIINFDNFIKGIVSANKDSPTISLIISNEPALELPRTGSNQILITVVIGSILLAFSAIDYTKKKEVN